MRLNLGCGDQYARGWHNVDFGSPHRKDQEVDLTGPLPWASESVTAVYAGHVLEHLTIEQCHTLLTNLLPCMTVGGEILVVGPDLERAEGMAQRGTLDVTLDSLRYGAGRWAGDVHQWECTPSQLRQMLRVAGWGQIQEMSINDVPPQWPVAYRGPQWQCAVSARRTW